MCVARYAGHALLALIELVAQPAAQHTGRYRKHTTRLAGALLSLAVLADVSVMSHLKFNCL